MPNDLVLAALRPLALLLALALPTGAEVRLTIEGSATMLPLSRELAESYAALHEGVTVEVVGTGSEAGLEALLAGRADLAAVSRRLTDAELDTAAERLGRRPEEVVVALDGIGVYVHTSNRVRRLTLDQLAGIYSGRIRNWKDVGGRDLPIDVYNRTERSGTRAFVQAEVLGGSAFTELARELGSPSLLVAAVADNPRAIAYSRVGYFPSARVLRIARAEGEPGVQPSPVSVPPGAYPLSRPLCYYLDPAARDEVQPFLDWALSPRGQRVVSFLGFSPAPGRGAAPTEAGFPAEDPGVVRLTPETMEELGMRVAVALSRAEKARQRRVTLVFAGGEAIDAVERLTLRLGKHGEIPLRLDPDRSVSFALDEEVLAGASLRLEAPARSYELRLTDFATLAR